VAWCHEQAFELALKHLKAEYFGLKLLRFGKITR
jgi:hypothetical protein